MSKIVSQSHIKYIILITLPTHSIQNSILYLTDAIIYIKLEMSNNILVEVRYNTFYSVFELHYYFSKDEEKQCLQIYIYILFVC